MSFHNNYPYDVIFFDLDGTLIETSFEIADAINDVLHNFNLETLKHEQIVNWIGHGGRQLLIRALEFRLGVEEGSVRNFPLYSLMEAEFEKCYKQRCGTRSKLYPHVRSTIKELRRLGVRLVIMTNKESIYVKKILASHNLDKHFDHIICGDTYPVKKPNPFALSEYLSNNGISNKRALFVGDSSIDIETAKNANIEVWVLPYGYNMGVPINSCEPDRVINDFSNLIFQCGQ